MITYDPTTNVGFDFDVNIAVNDDNEDYSPEEIRTILHEAFSHFMRDYAYTKCEQSTRVISMNYFSWEFQTQPYKELEARADYLKTNGHWDEVLEVYLEKKNSNDNSDKHSRSLYAETINECFSRHCNHK